MNVIRLAVLSSLLSLPTVLFSQAPTPPGYPAPGTATPSTAAEASAPKVAAPERIDLKIDGTSLPDLIDYLAETTGKNMVLLVPPSVDAGQIKVPALKLRHVSLDQILELIMQMPGTALSYDVSGDGESQIYSIRVEGVEQAPTPLPPPNAPGAPMPPEPYGGMGAFNAMGGGYPSAPGEPFLSVLPLERVILGNSPAERVPDETQRKAMLEERTKQALTLLDQAFAMTPQGEAKPEIKLHPETNTLLVKASPAQLQVINQVLSALEVPGPSDLKRDFERQAAEQQMRLESDRARMDSEMKSRSINLAMDLDRMQKASAELEARMRELTIENERLKAQLQAKQDQKPSQPQ